jgi:hypothetical protein
VRTGAEDQHLRARLEWSGPEFENRVVAVYFGSELIVELPMIRESKASHGDDSRYYDEEEEAIVAETVAPYLRKMFEAVK